MAASKQEKPLKQGQHKRIYVISYTDGDEKTTGSIEADSWEDAAKKAKAYENGRVIGLSDESVLLSGQYLSLKVAFGDGLREIYINRNGAVIYRLWDLLRAAIGGQDRERLAGAKQQLWDIVAEHVYMFGNLIEDEAPALELVESSLKGELRTNFFAYDETLEEKLNAFGSFMLVDHQLDFWKSRVERICHQDAYKWFEWLLDDIIAQRDKLKNG